MRLPALRIAVIIAFAAGIMFTSASAAAPTPHRSCAGGANQLTEIGLPAPGPLLGPAFAESAQGGFGAIGGPGLGDEVAFAIGIVCEPRP